MSRDGDGSSPHTRGLLAAGPHPHGWPRIIPAHAGFTSHSSQSRGSSTDHPRTRGVYLSQSACTSTTPGSSPHTRGLQPWNCPRFGTIRIIPAHAGFTQAPVGAHTPVRDHPRTRGVYLPSSHGQAGSARIIPAHAGFTVISPSRASTSPDHPRTRGVYSSFPQCRWFCAGSSPHTRGLPQHHVADALANGINPAHAWFTDACSPGHVPSGDHPRTRGVYPLGLATYPPLAGSSPHTRGLPSPTTQCRLRPRIIPAHAGFTACA